MIVTDFDNLICRRRASAIYAFESSATPRIWTPGRALADARRAVPLIPARLARSLPQRACQRHRVLRQLARELVGANLWYKLRRLGFSPIKYRRLQFWAWGLTWNFIQHMLLWKYRLKMRTFIELEWIIWRTSKTFVFGNPYNTVLAMKPLAGAPSALPSAASSEQTKAHTEPTR